MSKSDFLEQEFLRWCTGQANTLDDGLIVPWLALFTVSPSDSGGGTEVPTTGGTGYSRVNAAGKFANTITQDGSGRGVLANNALIVFATPTASWGTIVAYGLYTAQTGGQLLRWENMVSSKVTAIGDAPQFPSGKLQLIEG